MKTLFAADIGGTNSRFGHFRINRDGRLELLQTKWLPTAQSVSFARLIAALSASGFSLSPSDADVAVIAIAGPVERASFSAPSNIPWAIDLNRERDGALGRNSFLVNDFVAQAYACRSPLGLAAKPILSGEPVAAGVIGVLGAGTALGKATLAPVPGNGFLALPSEGGHACFPFISEEEFAFQKFYREKSGQNHISGNLVVSGNGLRYTHWFLTGEERQPQEVAALFAAGKAAATLSWAARFYGRVCRDYALEALTLGGLYIAGGVAARNPGILGHENFRAEFLDSPTLGHLLAKIPVFLMDDQDSGLWGAAFYGQQTLEKDK